MRCLNLLRVGFVFVLLTLLMGLGIAAHASSADAVWPESSGTDVQTDGKLVIDASHMDQGYVMCCVSAPTDHGLKMRVTYSGAQLTYDLDNAGDYEVFPLQLGSGKYEFALFENVKGSKYSAQGKVVLSAQLTDENAAFLVPNQYVDYVRTTNAVVKSDEICSQGDVYNAVLNFMKSEFSYDFVRQKAIASSGQFLLPEIEECFDARAGVCQDLSAIMVCMLRVQGIPARLVIGYADKYYHAWTVALVDGKEVFCDPTHELGCMDAKKYTTERFY
ncbi:MAG: transglutaminase family protein [Clostridia bacterium]|nr:transglutaminase family protein [Clostridia bacterium]MBQ9039331.1 transglutaminase family protein [Clostridia bacterium]